MTSRFVDGLIAMERNQRLRSGTRIRVEAHDYHYGTVLRLIRGEAEIMWDGGTISRLDAEDCEVVEHTRCSVDQR